MNKNISTATGIIIIVAIAVFVVGILAWQQGWILESNPALIPAPSPTPTPDETANWKTYRNEKYGFEIILLDSWEGYLVLEESWNGVTLEGTSKQFQGPKIIIRNPKWTENKPWQDIPVMVFTRAEWELIKTENLNVSAAPIPPGKLGENQKYVFALSARWIGFTDALGKDESLNIVATFKAF